MKHFNSILASLLMFVGWVFAGNVSAQTDGADWNGAAVGSVTASSAKPVFLYNVGAKAFFVNGGDWGTHASLNTKYGLPFRGVTNSSNGVYRFETDLKTTQGTYLCLITSSNEFYCDRNIDSSDGNVNLTFTAVPGSTNNEYYISVRNNGTKYMTANAIVGNSKKGSIHTTSAVDGDLSKWIIITYDEIRRHLEKSPADLNNPTDVTYLIKDPNLDRGSRDEQYWKLVNWTSLDSDGANWNHVQVTTPESNRTYRLGYNNGGIYYFMTLAEDGTLGVTTDPDEAAVWTTSPNYQYFYCNGRYLIHTNNILGTSTNRSSTTASWSYSRSNGIYYGSGSSRRRLSFVDGAWTLANNTNNLAHAYTSTKETVQAGGLKLGAQDYFKTAPDDQGESTVEGDNSNSYRTEWGKYFGAEARGVYGKFQQEVKVFHTGWYSVSCEGFYWNANKTNNDVVSLFVTIGDETRTQFLSLGNNEGAVPTDWHAAAKALFPGTRYTNAVMFFVQMDNADPKTGFDANGKVLTIGLDWNRDFASVDDWTVFDDFQLEFMGYNTNLILEENNLNYDYLTKTVEEYKNATLLLNRDFTENAWNTLVLPVELTKKQFLTAFGANARIANLNEVKNGVLRFETIMKSDKADDFVLLEANKPYIVYIANKPSVTKEYQASLNPIEGTDPVVKTIGGSATGPYYEIPFVTLDKANLAGVTPYTYGSGDETMTFNGTLVKTYEGNTIRDGFDDMVGNIIFKEGKLWWLDDVYGMKAYRAWLEPGNGYFDGEDTSAGAKISFEIDGVEDDATYIHGIFNEGESTAEKFANGIYTINGMNMSATSVENLPKGIYIVNGKKYIVK